MSNSNISVNGSIFIVSAPSGAGKTSLVAALLEQDRSLQVSISHTTRARRANEIHSQHYYFVSDAEFARLEQQGQFIEHARVFDRLYGTSYYSIEAITSQGKDIILDIDWQGARQIKRRFPQQSVSIFLLPPSMAVLQQRLLKRGQDEHDTIKLRMQQAQDEMQHFRDADYLIINDDFAQSLTDLQSIIRASRLTTGYQAMHSKTLLDRIVHDDFPGLV